MDPLEKLNSEPPVDRRIHSLTTTDLADFYSLSYAMQMSSVYPDVMPEDAMTEADKLLEDVELSIALASVDALTRELILGGATLVSGPTHDDPITQEWAASLDNEDNPYLTPRSVEALKEHGMGLAGEEFAPQPIGATMMGMRLKLAEIVANGATTEEVKKLCKDAGVIGQGVMAAASRSPMQYFIDDVGPELASKTVISKFRNWDLFAQSLQAFGESESGLQTHDHIIATDELINAQHSGSFAGDGSMLHHTAKQSETRITKQLLDAKHSSDGGLFMEGYASPRVRELLSDYPALNVFESNQDTKGRTLFEDKSLEALSGKVRGLTILKTLGYPVPTYSYYHQGFGAPRYVQELHADDPEKREKLWAVRSSANVEDSSDNSFAGLFTSKIGINASEIEQAIEQVRHSVHNDRVMNYCAAKNINPHGIKMDIIIQEFEEPVWSGVWIGDNQNGVGVLEWVDGRGSNLVDATITPTQELHSYQDDGIDGIVDENGRPVAEICREIEERVGCAVDLEFAMTESGLKWVQMRPVTAAPRLMTETTKGKIRTGRPIMGEGISPYVNTGRAYSIESEDEIPEGERVILIASEADERVEKLLYSASGLVTAVGGRLSHIAIICRELGIPYVSGVDISAVVHGTEININGQTGEVALVKQKSKIGQFATKILRR